MTAKFAKLAKMERRMLELRAAVGRPEEGDYRQRVSDLMAASLKFNAEYDRLSWKNKVIYNAEHRPTV